jgi:DoxX-like family
MIIAVWIVSGLLALVYVIAGGVKVVASRETVQSRLSWTRHARVWQVKAVGTIEVLAAIGLVAPPLTHILPILAAVAAAGLVLVQVVAIGVHVRIGEGRQIAVNVVLLLLALFVATARFTGLA